VTRRLARTIFVGAAPTLGGAHVGSERPRVWLGVAIPGDTVGNFGSALDMLLTRATYLYADGQRYWYDTQASVQRTAVDIADRLRDRPEDVWWEIVTRLRSSEPKQRGGFSGVHVAPDSTGDVPDDDSARLVILSPATPHSKGNADSAAMTFAKQILDKKGSSQRTNRNMLVFLAADTKRLDELMESTRDFMAWDNIASRVDELNLSPQQAKQALNRRDSANESVTLRIGQTYIHGLVPEQPDPSKPITWTTEKSDGQEVRLAVRVTDKLARAGLLSDVYAPRMIRMDLEGPLAKVWESGHVSVGELWQLYSQFPYLARLRDHQVLVAAVVSVLSSFTWEAEGFALADSFDSTTGRYEGLVLPGGDATFGMVTDQTLVVRPEIAAAQAPAAPTTEEDSGTPGGSGEGSLPPSEGAAPVSNRRFRGVYTVDPERYSRDLTKLSQEILQHLASTDGVVLEVTVEIQATAEEGFPNEKARIIIENAQALKFDESAFD